MKKEGVGPLIRLLKGRSKCFRRPGYKLEAALWCMASSEKHWLDLMPSGRCIGRLDSHQGLNQLRKCVVILQQGYDYERPLWFRYRDIFRESHKFTQVGLIDKELLLWGSLVRWLLRSKCYDLAEICLHHYQDICLKLTDGEMTDVLGALLDIPHSKSMSSRGRLRSFV